MADVKVLFEAVLDERGVITGFKRVEQQATQTARTIDQQMQQSGKAIGDFGKSFTMKVGAPIGAAMAATALSFGKFDQAMRKITALAGVSSEQLDSYRGAMKRIGEQTAISGTHLADAMYFISSAGLRGERALSVLDMSAKAAASGLGDLGTVADAVTSAMNAYAKMGLTAEAATDVLVATVREGKMPADELAGSLGRVLPIAAQVGVRFDEIGASVASMTRIGLDSAEAVTALRGALAVLSGKAGRQADEALAKVGLTIEDLQQKLRKEGLLAALQSVTKAFEGNDNAILQVFGSIRAYTGLMSVAGKSANGVAGIFERVTNSTGAMNDAWEKSQGPMLEFERQGIKLKGALKDIGEVTLPIVTEKARMLADAVVGLVHAFRSLDPAVQSAVMNFAGWAVLLGPALIGVGALVKGIGALIAAYHGLTAAIAASGGVMGTFKASVIGMGTAATTAKIGLAGLVGFLSYELTKAIMDVTGAQEYLNRLLATAPPIQQWEAANLKALSDRAKMAEDGAYAAYAKQTGDPAMLQHAEQMQAAYQELNNRVNALAENLKAAGRETEASAAALRKMAAEAPAQFIALEQEFTRAGIAARKEIAATAAESIVPKIDAAKVARQAQVVYEQLKADMERIGDLIKSPLTPEVNLDKLLEDYKKANAAAMEYATKNLEAGESAKERLAIEQSMADAVVTVSARKLEVAEFDIEQTRRQIAENTKLGIGIRELTDKFKEQAKIIVEKVRASQGDLAARRVEIALAEEAKNMAEEWGKAWSSAREGAKPELFAQEWERALYDVSQRLIDLATKLRALQQASGGVIDFSAQAAALETLGGAIRNALGSADTKQAVSGMAEWAKNTLSKSVADGLIEAFKSGKVTDAWQAVANAFAGFAAGALGNALTAIMEPDREKRMAALEAGGWGTYNKELDKFKVNWVQAAATLGGILGQIGQVRQNRGLATIGGALSGAVAGGSIGGGMASGAAAGSTGGWNWVGAIIGAVVGGVMAYLGSKGPSKETAVMGLLGGRGYVTEITGGVTRAAEVEVEKRITDRYRSVSMAFRDALSQLGQSIGKMPDITLKFREESKNLAAAIEAFISGTVPEAVFDSYKASLEKGLEAFGVSSGRIAEEMARFKAGDFDKALQAFTRYVAALVGLKDLSDELSKSLEQLTADVSLTMRDQFIKSMGDTLEEIGRLSEGLDEMTSEEQVNRAEQIAKIAAEQYNAALQYLKNLVDLQKQMRASFDDIFKGFEQALAEEKGPAALAEWYAAQIRNLMKQLGDLTVAGGSPEELQRLIALIQQYGQALWNLGRTMKQSGNLLADFTELISRMARPLEYQMADALKGVGETERDAFMRAADDTMYQIGRLAEGLRNLSAEEQVSRLQQIGALASQQYEANLAYLRRIAEVQREVMASFEATLKGFERTRAAEGGPQQEAYWLYQQMEQLRQQLQAARTPEEIQRITQQMNEYANALFNLGKEANYGGVDWRAWAEQYIKEMAVLAQARLDAMAAEVQAQQQLLVDVLQGIKDMLGGLDTFDWSQWAEDQLRLAQGIADELLAGWQAEVKDQLDLLKTAIGGVTTALQGQTEAYDDWNLAISGMSSSMIDTTNSFGALIDAVDRFKGKLDEYGSTGVSAAGAGITIGGEPGPTQPSVPSIDPAAAAALQASLQSLASQLASSAETEAAARERAVQAIFAEIDARRAAYAATLALAESAGDAAAELAQIQAPGGSTQTASVVTTVRRSA